MPREHAARRAVEHGGVGARHPAQEQVQHAREVLVGVVARQAPAQVAVQRDRVEQGLEPVVGAAHLRGERGRRVVAERQLLVGERRASSSCSRRSRSAGRAGRVGGADTRATRSMLPVRKPRTLERSAGSSSRPRRRPGDRPGARWARRTPAIASRVSRPLGSSPPTSGKLEPELVQPVARGADPGGAGRRRAARAASRSPRAARRPRRRRCRARAAGEPRRARPARQRRVEILGGEVGRLEHAVHERAERDPDGHPAKRRGQRELRRRRAERGPASRREPEPASASRVRRAGSAPQARLTTSGSCAAAVMSL